MTLPVKAAAKATKNAGGVTKAAVTATVQRKAGVTASAAGHARAAQVRPAPAVLSAHHATRSATPSTPTETASSVPMKSPMPLSLSCHSTKTKTARSTATKCVPPCEDHSVLLLVVALGKVDRAFRSGTTPSSVISRAGRMAGNQVLAKDSRGHVADKAFPVDARIFLGVTGFKGVVVKREIALLPFARGETSVMANSPPHAVEMTKVAAVRSVVDRALEAPGLAAREWVDLGSEADSQEAPLEAR